MRKKGLFPLILGLLLLTVFALAAFAPEIFTNYEQKVTVKKSCSRNGCPSAGSICSAQTRWVMTF